MYREFGLPQGSALSPILFKFYIHDLEANLSHKTEIEVFKFADDGTLRMFGDTTPQCLEKLKEVCNALHKWSTHWRMIINCDPSKTELICFGTSENDSELIPDSVKLGQNTIAFVEKTKVLGLTMDRKLKYIEHGKDINRKILGRWVMICKHTNRNWGFKQHVIVRLLEVLIATCIHYAGVVWINPHSIKEVEKLWYKIIKSAVGAVFNIKTSLAEAILGVQPITVSNKINSIKHLLQLNIFHDTDDPMKQFVTSHLQSYKHSKLAKKLKYTFTFLNWKTTMYEKSFTDKDLEIIRNLEYERFAELSTRSCCYSKLVIKMYSEMLWQESMDKQSQLDGFNDSPKVSCTKLVFPTNTSRKIETLVLSFLYPNNLMNEFLYRYNKSEFFHPCVSVKKENKTRNTYWLTAVK